ncbi:MalY/PatB family protein [Palleronia abyssalis]|uniref:cysteine-S-conjugate beta-lyase n=1 Tax=Palleronia abyssalis TaxID=1501240 RepID=A0A2R8C081_9RHOB|nr:PatB family C-S lyase [Palleronia abyssalis]SPJ25783.1 Cystathionine beta-lyase PatB [Palleronia abyssalis]
MSFDDIIDRRGTHSAKWDAMEKLYGVPAEDGLAMWVADMDFRPPHVVQDALRGMLDHGVYGYYADDGPYREAIRWWMDTRHGWQIDPSHIFTTHGLVNGTGLCLDTFTAPGDAVVVFSPVYHAFGRVVRAAGRELRELEMPVTDGKYTLDFDAFDAAMTGSETMLILCSPHNPGGRVWTRAELDQIADFARRHELILVSDEIHHDLVFPGHTHTPTARIEGIADRLVTMTAASKTFNIAGAHTGNVIIADEGLRTRFAARMAGLGLSPNSFGLTMTEAAYSPEGAAWVDELVAYLDGNRRMFDDAVADIPGLASMPLESTYLSWVDTSGTGMPLAEVRARVEDQARIAANLGPTFGKGGESFLRFNIGTPRARIEEACTRLRDAFADLQ